MNSYEKKKAQIEKKKLYRKYWVWVYPQSDVGEAVLTASGFYTEYNLFYHDESETEEQRLINAKDVAHAALAYKLERFSHRDVSTKKYKIRLNGSTRGYDRDLVDGIDYEMRITEVPIEHEPELTFDNIKTL
ncbi:hypothetical protein [Planococcus beigongshangi]|uniref:hypothetical protein n=1 Tax=Planococcus beigongshangi TaxID=2782536 RepID=UPI00193B2E5B|nr:hypothetical protein [Planococcus beigongshangi]